MGMHLRTLVKLVREHKVRQDRHVFTEYIIFACSRKMNFRMKHKVPEEYIEWLSEVKQDRLMFHKDLDQMSKEILYDKRFFQEYVAVCFQKKLLSPSQYPKLHERSLPENDFAYVPEIMGEFHQILVYIFQGYRSSINSLVQCQNSTTTTSNDLKAALRNVMIHIHGLQQLYGGSLLRSHLYVL